MLLLLLLLLPPPAVLPLPGDPVFVLGGRTASSYLYQGFTQSPNGQNV
jgi:hypothetical protein